MEELIEKLKREKIAVEGGKITLFEYLIKPGSTIKSIIKEGEYPEEILKEVEIEVKYSPYVKQMLSEIKELRDIEKVKLPKDIDYSKIHGLSLEIKEKLSSFRPLTLGQASRISGITPAAISILMVYLKKRFD